MTWTLPLRYLLGQASSITTVASSRAAFPTGIALVFLTSIARNHDQSFILEFPARWLFGNLAFSLVSGTWLYLTAYVVTTRLRVRRIENRRPDAFAAWPGFMGLFWFTAPIGWIYGIPVERFLGELEAAHANLAFLGVVSFWRVALMIRVLTVLFKAPPLAAAAWVLMAVLMETFLVTFFGGVFARSIAAGMAGLRHSPAEALVLDVLGTAMAVSFFGTPIAIVASVAALKLVPSTLAPFPDRVKDRFPTAWLSLLLLPTVLAAVPGQRQTRNSAQVDRLTREGQYREAVRFLADHSPEDFAAARPLPPRAYEFEVFEQMPAFFLELEADHPEWLRRHWIHRMQEFTMHFEPWSKDGKGDVEGWVRRISSREGHFGFEQHLTLVTNLSRLPEGRDWLRSNTLYLPALERHADEAVPLLEGSESPGNPIRRLRRELALSP